VSTANLAAAMRALDGRLRKLLSHFCFSHRRRHTNMSCKSHSFINSILQVELPARTCCARPEVGINAIVLLSAPELDRDALIYLATLLVVRQGGVDVPLERQCVACSPEHHTIQLKIFAHPNGMRETTITVDIQNGTQPCTVRVIPYSRSGDGVKALIRLIPKEKVSTVIGTATTVK